MILSRRGLLGIGSAFLAVPASAAALSSEPAPHWLPYADLPPCADAGMEAVRRLNVSADWWHEIYEINPAWTPLELVSSGLTGGRRHIEPYRIYRQFRQGQPYAVTFIGDDARPSHDYPLKDVT